MQALGVASDRAPVSAITNAADTFLMRECWNPGPIR